MSSCVKLNIIEANRGHVLGFFLESCQIASCLPGMFPRMRRQAVGFHACRHETTH